MTDSPFVGPDPLCGKDLLFGRDRDRRRILDLLIAERIVLLHSPSGAGKSSFIQAGLDLGNSPHHGLLKELQKAGFATLPATRANDNPRAWGRSLGAELNRYSWSIRKQLYEHRVPGAFSALSHNAMQGLSLSEFLGQAFPEESPQRPTNPNEPPNGEPPGDPDYLAWVLVIDQFEEVLTEDPTDAEAKKQFFKELGEAMRERRNIWFVLVMREEFTAELDPYLRYLPRRIPARYRLGMLSKKAAAGVIEQIDKSTGSPRFRPDGIEEMVHDLVSFRVAVPGGEFETRERDYVEPMHMQIECRDLWNHHSEPGSIGAAEARGHGDLKHSLMRYYDEQLTGMALGDDQRQVRAWLDKHLILREKYRYQIPREGTPPAGKTAGLSNTIVDRLIDAHILREENRDNNLWLELAHDRLVEAVHDANDHWYQLHLGRFQQFALQWDKNERPAEDLILGQRLALMQARWKDQTLQPYEAEFLNQSLAMEKQRENARQIKLQEQRDKEAGQKRRIEKFESALASLKKEKEFTQEAARRRTTQRLFIAMVIFFGITLAAYLMQRHLSSELEVANAQLATERDIAKSAQSDAMWERDAAKALRDAAARLNLELSATAQNYETTTRLSGTSSRLLDQAPGKGELPALLARQASLLARRSAGIDPRLTPLADAALRRVFARDAFGRQLHDPNWQVDKAIAEHAGRACLLVTGNGEVDEIAIDFLDGTRPQTITLPQRDGTPRAVAVSQEAELMAIATDKGLGIWPLPPKDQAPLLDVALQDIALLAFAPDGDSLAVLTASGTLYLYATQTSAFSSRKFEIGDETWSDIAFSADARTLVAGAEDATLAVLSVDAPAGAAARQVDLGDTAIGYRLHSLALTPDGGSVVVAVTSPHRGSSEDNGQLLQVSLADEQTAGVMPIIAPERFGGRSAHTWDRIALSDDGRQLATGAADGTIGLWQLPAASSPGPAFIRATALRLFRAQRQPIRALRFVPDGDTLVSVDARATTHRWTPLEPAGAPIAEPKQAGPVLALSFDPKTGLLVSAGSPNGLLAWDPARGFARSAAPIQAGGSGIRSLSIGASGRHAVIGRATGEIELIVRNGDGDRSYQRRLHGSPVAKIALSPTGSRFVSADSGGRLLVWDSAAFIADPQGYEPRQLFPRAGNALLAFAFSPDGDHLAVAGRSMPLQVWDLEQPDEPPRQPAAPAQEMNLESALQVTAIAFSPDDRHLASARSNGAIRVQEWRSEDPSFVTLNTDGTLINELVFAPDGGLVTGYANGNVKKWSLERQFADPITLTGFHRRISALAVSADGTDVAAGGAYGGIAVWHPIDPSDLTEQVCELVSRNLSLKEWNQYIGRTTAYECSCPDLPPGAGAPADACTQTANAPLPPSADRGGT